MTCRQSWERSDDTVYFGNGLRAQLARLLDHRVGAGDQHRWNGEVERFGRLESNSNFGLAT